MKIAVPWPSRKTSQDRVKLALSYWKDPSILLLCLTEPADDTFVDSFDHVLLNRNSKDIGTLHPKCYIHDMIREAVDRFPGQDFYGFANSDVVPVNNAIEGFEDYEALIFHRTEIDYWEYMSPSKSDGKIPTKIADWIIEQKHLGITSKKIARELNKKSIKPPVGEQEWTYPIINDLSKTQGEVFFWGQDMFVFRNDVVDCVLESYLKKSDPIIATGGFDPRLSRWLMENCKAMRVLNRLFHQKHHSEWNPLEIEYIHNGGDIPIGEHYDYYNHEYVVGMIEGGYKAALPKYLRFMLKNKNPESFKKLFPEKQLGEDFLQ